VTASPPPPAAVFEQFALDPASLTPLGGGHINQTFAVRRADGTDCVLQRVNAIFPPGIHDDIDAVTSHLARKGLATPRLVGTRSGQRCLSVDGAIWRLLTRVPGETFEALSNDPSAHEAGRVLGQFHAALADFSQPLRNRRPGVHDLARHLAALDDALATHGDHPAHAGIAALAARIRRHADALDAPAAQPNRLVHGDPKISNVIFAGGRGVCLVDLDTITRMPVALELGDAFRSWCNLAAEDSPEARFSVDRFAAALAGYREGSGSLLGDAEWQAVPAATLGIAVELAARFAADALNESYFGWDRQRFARAAEHNAARAAAQLALADSIAAVRTELDTLVTKA